MKLNINGDYGQRKKTDGIAIFAMSHFSEACNRILNDNKYRLENSLLYSHRAFDEIEETISRIMRKS